MVGTRGTRAWCVVLASAAASLAPSVMPAGAAVPVKNGDYSGRTSQGQRMDIAVDRDGEIDNAEAFIRLSCTHAGPVRFDVFAVAVPVSLTGRFTDADYESGVPDFARVTRNQTAGLDVTHETLAGRFVSRREARGTWRLQTMILSPGTFPYDPSLLDSCDSGVVTWTARLRSPR